MLKTDEIKLFMAQDAESRKKWQARIGARYYEAEHDIRDCRFFYYNSDEQLVEDTTRANVKISHPFFTELCDQGAQYILSGDEPFVRTNDAELQKELDKRFNDNDAFKAELMEVITDTEVKGFAYMYAQKGADDRLKFTAADSLGVAEIEARFADDKKDHVLYWYVDRIDKDGHVVKKIQDWDNEGTTYWVQNDDGEITKDKTVSQNPRPHVVFTEGNDPTLYGEGLGFIPFFRLDNNRKQLSNLKPIKSLIDDYDFMSSSLSNNLIDFDHPLYVVKGFQGHDMDKLMQNIRTKKSIGTAPDGAVEIHTVDVPYEARRTKMELDEKNIYRFGMGLNMAGLKDVASGTTNMLIKAAYSLLDLRCNRLEMNIKRFLRNIVTIVVDEINTEKGTAYQSDDVYFQFDHEVMSNEQENAQIALTEAQRVQTVINTLLGLHEVLGADIITERVCECLDLDYDEIKSKLPKQDETDIVSKTLDETAPDEVVTPDEQT